MSTPNEPSAEDAPRQKTDWAALRRQNEAEFLAGLDRVAVAYTEQREAPWKQWEEDFKTEMNGRAAMQLISRQLITHGALQAHAKHLASLVTMSPLRRQFNELSYQVPAAVTATLAQRSANDPSININANIDTNIDRSMIRLSMGPMPCY